MKIRTSAACAVVAAVSGSAAAQAPAYTFEMRLIPDGTSGAPNGPWSMHPLPANYNGGGAVRIGFWLQACVAQIGRDNWGVTRAAGSISASATGGFAVLYQGTINGAGTQSGRGAGYRLPPNANELDGFDAYVGSTRSDNDFDGDFEADDDGDGLAENPWGINGSLHSANVSGTPLPGDGTFSPWANLYRVWVDLIPVSGSGSFTLSAHANLNGSVQALEASPGINVWAMQMGSTQSASASYTFNWPIPTPGGAALLGLGVLCAARRRR